MSVTIRPAACLLVVMSVIMLRLRTFHIQSRLAKLLNLRRQMWGGSFLMQMVPSDLPCQTPSSSPHCQAVLSDSGAVVGMTAPRLNKHTVAAAQMIAPTATPRQAAQSSKRARLEPPVAPLPSATFLENKQVRTPTQRMYRARVQALLAWCALHSMTWGSDTQLDAILAQYFDMVFFKGFSVEYASRTIAALKFFISDLKRGGRGSIPRATAALRTFRRLCPAVQRLPLPLVCLGAIMGFVLARHGWRELCLKWMLTFRAYLRPGEADRLTAGNIVSPQAAAGAGYCQYGLLLSPQESMTPGKTGLYDESVTLDTDPQLWPLLGGLLCGKQPQDPLWSVPLDKEINAFNDAVEVLQLQPLNPCRYAMRHGGASEDLLLKTRPLAEVMKRGRWRSDASLRRYAKDTRLLAELGKVPIATQQFGQRVLATLPLLLHGRLDIQAPQLRPWPPGV